MWQEIAVFIIGLIVIFYIGKKIYKFFTHPTGTDNPCQGPPRVPDGFFSYSKLNYSALAGVSVAVSAAGASAAGASSALAADFLERRVRVFFVACLAMFSS